MPRVGFEPTIVAFERVKTVHALDPATTVTSDATYADRILMDFSQTLINARVRVSNYIFSPFFQSRFRYIIH
jgi:hypothetical protein